MLAEVASAARRATGDASFAARLVAELTSDRLLSFESTDLDHARAGAQLAADHSLKGCDAIYVALAAERGEALVTLDREQAQRARTVVTVIVPG